MWSSTHIWGGVDAVGVDHHWRGVGLQERTAKWLNIYSAKEIIGKPKTYSMYFTKTTMVHVNWNEPHIHTEIWGRGLTRLMFWYSMLSTSATDYHYGATANTAWHTAQPLYWTILKYGTAKPHCNIKLRYCARKYSEQLSTAPQSLYFYILDWTLM